MRMELRIPGKEKSCPHLNGFISISILQYFLCLFCSVAVSKRITQSNSGNGEVSFSLHVTVCHWEKSGQEPKEEIETETMKEHFLMAGVAHVLLVFVHGFLTWCHPTVGRVLLHQLAIKITLRYNHRQLWYRRFLREFQIVSNWLSQLTWSYDPLLHNYMFIPRSFVVTS